PAGGGGGGVGGGGGGAAPPRAAPPPPPAREAARLAARGDRGNALVAAQRIAPPSADIALRTEGTRAIAVVSARTPLLPLLTLRAEVIATLEPGILK
ncbi:TadE family type IV pilus minor pilin, partial [Nocardia asiatica]|uniref:TadE family type IV pilus minor pilin n=1 Tax=Nocardia asiatica TaxID=209252 RepID=UPI00245451F1